MPHAHCYLSDPFIYASAVFGDGGTAVAYFAIASAVLFVSHSREHFGTHAEAQSIGKLFAAFIFLCGSQHAWMVVTTHTPLYRVEAAIRFATMGVSVFTAFRIWPLYRSLRVKMAARIKEERDLLSLVTEHTTDGFWDWDIRTDADYMSPRWHSSLGYEEGDVEQTSKGWLEILHPDDRDRALQAVRAHLDSGVPYCEVLRHRRKDGTYAWILDRGAALFENGVAYRMLGTHTDVSLLKTTEEQLRRSNRDLEQFAYSASHDLQEPLRMISGWINALFEDYEKQLGDPEALKMKHYVLDGVTRMKRLIKDLLRFSRAGRDLQLAPISSEGALTDAMKNLSVSIAEADAEILYPTMPMVRADAAMLAAVFQNIISNSLKFRKKNAPCEIRIDATADSPFIRFDVSDNGIGIDARYQERIFDIFTRLYGQDEYDGTGIGLALVRRIVHAHGGEVWITSSGTDRGTTVSFTIPTTEQSGVVHAVF